MKNKIPQRMCVSCRNMFPKNQLVRLVATESGVKVDGEQVNMQIVQGENCLTAGFPLIMGSY